MKVNPKLAFLYLLIASVAVSSVIGIGVMLFGDFGEFETKVLLTAMTITATSVLGLACGACLEAGRGRIVPIAGITFAALSALLWLIVLWSRVEPQSDFFIHSVMSVTLLAFACSHISLLSLARLDRRFAWSLIAVHLSVWSLTGLILLIIWLNIDPSQTRIARTMGVLSIVIGALTVVTPVFHRLSSGGGGDEARIDAEIADLRKRIEDLEAKKAALHAQPKTVFKPD